MNTTPPTVAPTQVIVYNSTMTADIGRVSAATIPTPRPSVSDVTVVMNDMTASDAALLMPVSVLGAIRAFSTAITSCSAVMILPGVELVGQIPPSNVVARPRLPMMLVTCCDRWHSRCWTAGLLQR